MPGGDSTGDADAPGAESSITMVTDARKRPKWQRSPQGRWRLVLRIRRGSRRDRGLLQGRPTNKLERHRRQSLSPTPRRGLQTPQTHWASISHCCCVGSPCRDRHRSQAPPPGGHLTRLRLACFAFVVCLTEAIVDEDLSKEMSARIHGWLLRCFDRRLHRLRSVLGAHRKGLPMLCMSLPILAGDKHSVAAATASHGQR